MDMLILLNITQDLNNSMIVSIISLGKATPVNYTISKYKGKDLTI